MNASFGQRSDKNKLNNLRNIKAENNLMPFTRVNGSFGLIRKEDEYLQSTTSYVFFRGSKDAVLIGRNKVA